MRNRPKGPRNARTPARKCVFCGAGKLSEEHIWSQWARDLLPSSEGYLEVTNNIRDGQAFNRRIIRDAQGPITNKRLKRVCKPCNNVWMGRQEEAAKTIVTKLIAGVSSYLTKSQRKTLARWVVTKLMVLDVFRDGEQAFTDSERATFYEDWTIPESLSVWLLRCGEGPWRTLFWSHGQRVTVVMGDTWANAKPPSGLGPNLKLFLWGFGEALIVAAYVREIDPQLGAQAEYAIQLIPDQGVCRAWPPRGITGVEAASIQQTLLNLPNRFGWRLVELGQDGEPIT